MRILKRRPGSPGRRPLKPVALVFSTLLLILALACGAADEPVSPAAPAGDASPAVQSQPVAQPEAPVNVAPAEEPADATATEGMAKTEPAPAQGSQQQPLIVQPAVKQMPGEQPAVLETTPEKTTENPQAPAAENVESQPELVVKAVEAQTAPASEPASEPTEAMPAKQEAAPEPEPVEPTAAPAVVPAPAPTAAPQPTEAPAPVVQEPLPDVGNQVGNRMPDFTLELVGGTTVSVSNLVESGKPAFLFFTSST